MEDPIFPKWREAQVEQLTHEEWRQIYGGNFCQFMICMSWLFCHLRHAQSKHNDWQGKGLPWAVGRLEDEMLEVKWALRDYGRARDIHSAADHEKHLLYEIYDLMAVGLRILRGDWK